MTGHESPDDEGRPTEAERHRRTGPDQADSSLSEVRPLVEPLSSPSAGGRQDIGTTVEPADLRDGIELRRKGKVARTTVSRISSARCTECDETWTGNRALLSATLHVVVSGHETEGAYFAAYRYSRAKGGASK